MECRLIRVRVKTASFLLHHYEKYMERGESVRKSLVEKHSVIVVLFDMISIPKQNDPKDVFLKG